MGLKDKILEHFPKKSKKVTVSPKTEIPNNRKPEKDLVKDIPVIDSSAKDKSGESSSISLSPNHKASENDLSENDLLSKQTHSYQTLKEVKENTESERDSQKKALDTAKELPVKISESESQCDETVNKDSNEESSDFSNMNQTDTTVVSSSDTQTDSNTETEKEGGLNPTTPTENSTAQNQSDDNNIITDEGFENESALRMDSNPRPDVDNPISADLEINNEEKSDQDDDNSTDTPIKAESNVDTSLFTNDEVSETSDDIDPEKTDKSKSGSETNQKKPENSEAKDVGECSFDNINTTQPSDTSISEPPLISDDYCGMVGDISYFGIIRQGSSHIATNTVCQDKCYIRTVVGEPDLIVVAIADGVGSCLRSDEGASIAVRSSVNYVVNKLRSTESFDSNSIEIALKEAMEKAYCAVQNKADEIFEDVNNFCSTLTILVFDGSTGYLAHIGDDGIVALTTDGYYGLVTTRHKGDEPSSVFPLQSKKNWQFLKVESLSGLILATDGVLDSFVRDEYENNRVFFPIIRPITTRSLKSKEEIERIKNDYNNYFNSTTYREIVDDDISFIAVVNINSISNNQFNSFNMDEWAKQTVDIYSKIFKINNPFAELPSSVKESWQNLDTELLIGLPPC